VKIDVTDHALQRYRERVGPSCVSRRTVRADLRRAVEVPADLARRAWPLLVGREQRVFITGAAVFVVKHRVAVTVVALHPQVLAAALAWLLFGRDPEAWVNDLLDLEAADGRA
jgi:CO/xanthine dehydrogenase FAD-binding subunit